ncbi:carbonic anhydrase [Legionella steigerwaltii]|uniref:Carbonic anhydrase n=1 Tax=Legionella steigerwaltii TaxID=460 RepID=A0A378LD40_9GAMM|nr:carbonic anhydrase [Legionella steigerwaltii]KTD79472.1 carbonic anhydrase [Legionella steigerwaltii]STY24644.1 carbonic anhydrase [Legionella steigerwaltii]
MYLKLMEGIQRFQTQEYKKRKELFATLANGQRPATLLFACSDSRIIPALVTHTGPGDIFITRNVGNIINPYSSDPSSTAAAIEFAVKVLGVQEIVVCGHSRCGAMNGLHTPHLEETLPAVAAWLAETKSMLNVQDDLHNHSLECTTEKNVLTQIKNLKTHPAVIEQLETDKLSIHGWIYEFETGRILAHDQSTSQFLPIEQLNHSLVPSKALLTSKLLDGVLHFRKNDFPKKKELFQSLAQGQHPKALLFSCSDSRVIPSLITDTDPGELFVTRNVGNLVPFYTSIPSGEAAAVEYAVDVLGVQDIIVCGHSHCGAMKGLMDPDLEKELPAVASWLIYAKPTLERLKRKFPEYTEHSLVCTTKENILLQIENLQTHPAVIRKLSNKQLQLHAWFYDFESGEILIYSQEKKDFISFNDAVTEILLSDEVLTKMRTIVEEEAMNYLKNLASPQTADDCRRVMPVLNYIRFKGISVIWDQIKAPITSRIKAEFGGLCPHHTDERIISLIEKGLEVKLPDIRDLQKYVMASPGYHKFSGQMMRHFITMPKPQELSAQKIELAKTIFQL